MSERRLPTPSPTLNGDAGSCAPLEVGHAVVQLGHRHGAAPRSDDRREPRGDGRPRARPRRPRRVPPRRAADLRRVRRRGSTGWRAACSRSGSRRATASASGARTTPSGCWCSTPPRKIGVILVNINPAYRTHEVRVRAAAVGLPDAASPPPSSRRRDYRAMVDEVRPTAPGPRARRLPRHRRLGRPARRGPTRSRSTQLGRPCRRSCRSTTRSTSSTRAARPASRRARRSATTTSSTTASSSARAAVYTDRRPGVHPGALLPLLRDGAGQPRRAPRTAPRSWSRRPAFDAAADAPSGRRTSAAPACTACRRCSSPSSAIPTSSASTCRRLRTGIMAGSPCPVEVMKQCINEMHMDEVTICYGMTETSPVSTQTARRRPDRQARRHRRARAPPRRGQGRRPGDRAHRALAARRASSAPAATR